MTELQKFIKDHRQLDNQLVLGLANSAKSYVLAQSQKANDQQVIYLTANMLQATQVYEDLNTLLPNQEVHLFPMEESIVAEFATASKDLTAQRIDTLYFLSQDKPGIVVTPLNGLRHLLAPKDLFMAHTFSFEVGADLNLEAIQHGLINMGYEKEQMVEGPGQFSLRGGILDIYDLVSDRAYRLELFDTELDSIRLFDPETQKSLSNVDQALILPADDVVFDRQQVFGLAERLKQGLEQAQETISEEKVKQSLKTYFDNLIQRLMQGEMPENPHRYLDLYYPKTTSLLSYAHKKAVLVLDDYARLMEQEKALEQEEAEWLVEQVQHAIMLPSQSVKADLRDLLKRSSLRRTYFSTLQKGLGRLKFSEIYNFNYRSMPQFFSQMPLIKTEMERFIKQGQTVVVGVQDASRQKKVSDTFGDFELANVLTDLNQLQEGAVNIVVGALHTGFELPHEKIVFLNERELFNKVNKPVVRRQQNLTNAERLKNYSQLAVGDFVVHVNHGVGKYQGMETLDIGGIKQDYMSIIYQDDAKLFIPVTQINLIQKYVASDGREPKLNKLGGSEWVKTKRKVAKKIEDIADELIELYAKREAEVGFAFSKDNDDQRAFEDAFPYAETADQLRSAQEIKRDMEEAKPMDRLLVGDVGYGKTEVAMRAIFKAVQDGKQAAVLVPTTILAQQHFMTLQQRFEDFPINIALMSRFRSKKQQEETIEALKKGQVDVVVGTHRLVSKDVTFKDLGLIVIDEEQRFGVRHKERLKQLKTQVDVLTLTATPIPRTLHMSMLGVRDLSVIETPPANRYPVQTYVLEQNLDLVREGIERELSRGGQVFYLYNRVEGIAEKAQELSQLVPEARVAFAHGQMTEVELENILLAFMGGEYDVLVTTTIIETGVDLPNVNTLFIEDADRMGLSSLYQLRGRVGRTNRIAYAYFMYRVDKVLSESGEKRLEAIKEFTQLGAGFKIAMRDLSIRGAGNLLGQQQSGFIDSVGFDLYTEMLKEAVALKKTGKPAVEKTVELDLGITAYLPASYIADERQKIEIYKRIRTIQSLEDYQEIQDDLIDRFGDYPQEVADLVAIGLIKYYAQKQGVEKIKRNKDQLVISFDAERSSQLKGEALFKQLAQTKLKATVSQENTRLQVSLNIAQLASYLALEEVQKFLAC